MKIKDWWFIFVRVYRFCIVVVYLKLIFLYRNSFSVGFIKVLIMKGRKVLNSVKKRVMF